MSPFSKPEKTRKNGLVSDRNWVGIRQVKWPRKSAEIRDCNLHVFGSECSPDGKYYVIDGKAGSKEQPNRIANLYEGGTGKKLSPDGLHLVWGNPSGAVTLVDLDRWTGDLADLVGDIQRYLNDEPIEPRPRTWLTDWLDWLAFTVRRDHCLRKPGLRRDK